MNVIINGETWKAEMQGDSVIFTCRICGYKVQSHVKNWETGFLEILIHIAETHARKC